MSLEQKIKRAFDDVTAPPQVKQETLAAVEARRASVEDAEKTGSEREAVLSAVSSQPQVKVHSQRGSRRRNAWLRYALPVAACLVLATVGIAGLNSLGSSGNGATDEGTASFAEQTEQSAQVDQAVSVALAKAVAYVGIDVNPSLELSLDEQDAVIAAEAKNTDAESVLAGLDLAGLPYDEALATLFASEAMAPYLADDALVEISVTTDDQALAQALVAQSDQALAQLPCGGDCQQVDNTTRVAAQEAGMGVGKYRVATELVELDSAYTMEDCSHMSMRQLRDAVDRCHDRAADASPSSQGQGQGQAQGQMQGQGYGQGQGQSYVHNSSGHHGGWHH